MKRHFYFGFFIISLISIVWFLQISNARYKSTDEIDLEITSTPIYFEQTGTDVTLNYEGNTANLDLTVHNYEENNYTIEDINYNISIDNSNYTFSAGGTAAINNKVSLVLAGGERNSETFNIRFNRLNTSNVPGTEIINVTVSLLYPYTYSETFKVNIKNESIKIEGNPTNWTKNDVTLTIAPTSTETTLTEYSFDGGNTWSANASKVYTQNTSNIVAYAKDDDGITIGPVSVDITKIDKTPPQFTLSNSQEDNADGSKKTVTGLVTRLDDSKDILTGIVATDTQSGIANDGIKCYRNGTQITSTSTFTTVGRYQVTYIVKDEVGNSTLITREILIRWPLAGKYIVARQNVIGTGAATSSTGQGLYQDNASTGYDQNYAFGSKYYYSGKNVNNYLSFAGRTFRVVNIPVNDDVKLISDLSGNKVKWGNRKIYDSDLYNNWQNWGTSKQLYNSNDGKYLQFTDAQFAHIDRANFYVGSFERNSDDSLLNIITYERTSTTEIGGSSAEFSGYFALPNVSDYIKACNRLDTIYNIRKTQTNQSDFANNSWLSCASGEQQWMMNSKNKTSTDNDYWTLNKGIAGNEIISSTYYYTSYYRPVFYLKNDTILSGTGSTSDGFTVRENWGWFDPNQTIQNDEYNYSSML